MNGVKSAVSAKLTKEQVQAQLKPRLAETWLAMLNKHVGVKGSAGAMSVLAAALGCTVEEASGLDEFEFGGIRFTKKVRRVPDGKHFGFTECWGVEAR